MPATAQPKVTVREPVRSSQSVEDWQDLLRAINPLSEWQNDFSAWREEIAAFRAAETQFFADRENALLQRFHMGWLCHLISEGQKLGIEILQEHPESAREHLPFLDVCIANLQATLETWHPSEKADLLSEVSGS